MDKQSPYYRQVALLLSALPVVASERCFALKGGTAINLFVRDFPRLSVISIWLIFRWKAEMWHCQAFGLL